MLQTILHESVGIHLEINEKKNLALQVECHSHWTFSSLPFARLSINLNLNIFTHIANIQC